MTQDIYQVCDKLLSERNMSTLQSVSCVSNESSYTGCDARLLRRVWKTIEQYKVISSVELGELVHKQT